MAAEDRDLNQEPITDDNNSHPVGTGVGAAGGAVAGAAVGAIGGPIGMAVGAVAGAVVGALAGNAAATAFNPETEEAHWRENYNREPYYEAGRSFDDYSPAYRQGMQARASDAEANWDAAEPKLASEWEKSRGGSSLSWPQAQPASRAAWDRVDTLGTGTRGAEDIGIKSQGAGMGSGTPMTDSSMFQGGGMRSGTGTGVGGAAAMAGAMQSAGDNSGDREDTLDVLEDLLEVCMDGEHGFTACAEQAQRSDLQSLLSQRAEDCRRGAQELREQIRACGGDASDQNESGSALGALHRGWVAVKSKLTTYDDKAVLEEAERGEDNALARYRKAAQKPLPTQVKQVVERQMQGVQRNHDQIKMLRNQFRAAS